MRQQIGGSSVLDRIPQQIGAAPPLAVGSDQRGLKTLEIGLILERGINEDKPASLRGRHVGV